MKDRTRIQRDERGHWTAVEDDLVGTGWNEVDAICDLLRKLREARETEQITAHDPTTRISGDAAPPRRY
jgi:hypothetical protein